MRYNRRMPFRRQKALLGTVTVAILTSVNRPAAMPANAPPHSRKAATFRPSPAWRRRLPSARGLVFMGSPVSSARIPGASVTNSRGDGREGAAGAVKGHQQAPTAHQSGCISNREGNREGEHAAQEAAVQAREPGLRRRPGDAARTLDAPGMPSASECEVSSWQGLW